MAHRSYQPALPCGNKLLQKRWDDAYFKEHQRRLRTAKCVVDTKPPAKHPHVTSKLKKQQLEQERTDQIDKDNFKLLHRMQQIMKTEGQVDHRNTYSHHSLNALKRQRELDRVAEENKMMLSRLQKVKPQYSISRCVEDWHRNAELVELITAYPSGASPTTQKKSKKSSSTAPLNTVECGSENNLKETEEKKATVERKEERSVHVTDEPSLTTEDDKENDETSDENMNDTGEVITETKVI